MSADPATATHPSGQAGTPGEAPPLASAMATILRAGFGLAGWAVGSRNVSPVPFVVSYIAGGTMATITAVTELTRPRLTADLFMILAAVGVAVLGDCGSSLIRIARAMAERVGADDVRAVRSLRVLAPGLQFDAA